MWRDVPKRMAILLILAALAAAGCASTHSFAPIPSDQVERQGGGGGY